MLDLFVFFDGGSISLKRFEIPDFRTSVGVGARIELGNRVPIMVGYGYPLNPPKRLVKVHPNGTKKYSRSDDDKRFFFSMGGQF